MSKLYPKQAKLRDPVDVFKSCPECAAGDLFATDQQVYCSHCDWNSLAQYLEADEAIFQKAYRAKLANKAKLKSGAGSDHRAFVRAAGGA